LGSNVSGSGNVALGSNGGRYELGSNAFYVTNVNQSNTANDQAYSLLYGKFSGIAASVTGQFLTINGAVNAPYLTASSAGTTGTVCWTTGTGAFTVDTTTTCLLSASRFKKDITESPYGLAAVMAMQPRSFYYRDAKGDANLQRRQVGFVAEEMAKVVPDAVSYEPDGQAKGVAYANLTAVLAKAIQEQQVEIDALKKERRASTVTSPTSGEALAPYRSWFLLLAILLLAALLVTIRRSRSSILEAQAGAWTRNVSAR